MERQLATIQKIDALNPIPGADKIEVADIKGWKVVVQKGIHQIGDAIVYFEIDSFLPDVPVFEFLKKGSSLKRMTIDGKIKVGIRLKTIKLRNQISQGLILPLKELTLHSTQALSQFDIGTDVSEYLGIIKYEQPIPAQLVGTVKGFFPGFIPKTDEERIQNMGDVLYGFYVTEKLDGSSVTFFKKDGIFGVCSRNLELKETEGNTQWRLARTLELENKLPDNFAIQGELVGEGIQGNPLKITGQKVYFFNAYNIASGKYLNFEDFQNFFFERNLNTVPIIDPSFSLPNTVVEMLEYAQGKSVINSETEREGVVVRPRIEMNYNGSRLSFKAISNKYLLDEVD